MSDPVPDQSPHTPPGWSLEALILVAGLGVSFISAGAALISLREPFQYLGLGLVVIGVVIVVGAALPHVRRLLVPQFGSRRWRFTALGGVGLLLAVAVGVFLWQRTGAPTERTMVCDRAGACVLAASDLAPGEPLIVSLADRPGGENPSASLSLDARLEGSVEGRYVALACRNDGDRGEYVFAVWPDDRWFELIRWDGPTPMILEEGRRPGTILPGNAVNRLELRCVGPAIGAAVNNTPVAEVSDDGLQGGVWYVAAGIGRAEDIRSGAVTAHLSGLTIVPQTPVAVATPRS